MSQPQVDNRDVIDLTGEPDTPPRVDSSSHHLHQSGRGARESQAAAQEIIDVDELDDRFDNIDSNLDNTSSDIELVSVRPRTQSVYPQRDRNSHTNPAMLAVPGRRRGLSAMRAISHRLAGLQGFLPTASATSQNRHIPPPRHRHFPASFILDTQIPRRLDEDDDEDDEFHISPHDFRVPNPDFETAAFQIGQEAALPTMPTYIAPPLAKEGFTRSPPEDSVLVCPNCDEELGMGEDELKRQVWIVRSCGHVGDESLSKEPMSDYYARSTAANVRSTGPRGAKLCGLLTRNPLRGAWWTAVARLR